MRVVDGKRQGCWMARAGATGGLLLAACAGMLACAANEDASESFGDSEKPEVVGTADQAVMLDKSYPNVLSSPWYATVKDAFSVELPNWRIHNNGCWTSCDVNLAINLRYYLDGVEQSNLRQQIISGKYHGPDARDYDWPVDNKPIFVERREKACFVLELWATNVPHGAFGRPKFCWNTTTMNWDPSGGDALPIGTSQSIYVKDSIDFDISFRFRLAWGSTTVDGLLMQNQGNPLDGPEWHHLPLTLWNNPKSVSVRMANSQGDADLYTSTGDRPTLDAYACRPYLGDGSTESCSSSNMTKFWASVRNYRSDVQSAYALTVVPQY